MDIRCMFRKILPFPFVFVAISIVMLLGLSGCQRLPSPASQEHVIQGLKYIKSNQYDQALTEMNSAIEEEPKYASAYLGRGIVYYVMGKNQALAKADFEKAIELNPKDPDGFRWHGKLLYDEKDVDGALNDFNKAIGLDPSSALYYDDRGVAYHLQWTITHNSSSLDLALEDLTKAIQMAPNQPGPYFDRGLVYQDMGNADLEIKDYNQALRIDPNYGNAYVERGYAYYKKGDYAHAMSDFDKAIEVVPSDPVRYALAYGGRGLIYIARGEDDKVLAEYQNFIKQCNASPECDEMHKKFEAQGIK